LIAEGPTPSERLPNRPPVRAGFVRNVLPALLWAAAIFVGGGSGVPQPHLPTAIPLGKVQHFFAFGTLQVLCFRALRYELPERTRTWLLWAAAGVSLLFGIALELYQLGLPDRSAEVADAVADGIGAALGALLLGRLRSV